MNPPHEASGPDRSSDRSPALSRTVRADAAASTIRDLSLAIRRMERSHQRSRTTTLPVLDTGPLLQLIGEEALPGGCLMEWLGDSAGAGLMTLALESVCGSLRDGLSVVIDSRREFFAPGYPLDLTRTVIVRPESLPDALWTLEQSLRTPGVAVVLSAVERLSAAAFRRLQLAAETGGTLGLLLRPERLVRSVSFAEYRLRARPLAMRGRPACTRLWELELLKARQRFEGTMRVEQCDGPDGRLRVVSGVAAPEAERHAS